MPLWNPTHSGDSGPGMTGSDYIMIVLSLDHCPSAALVLDPSGF